MAIPKLALIPASQGTSLYSVLPSNGVGDFTFTRAGSATRINSQGLIETVASGVSRLNYPLIDGVVNGCPSHLLEPQRTNFIINSEDIITGWSTIRVTVQNNQTISPDGTLNAALSTTTSTVGSHASFETLNGVLTAGSDNYISGFVKKSTTRYIRLNEGYTGYVVTFDLDTQTFVIKQGSPTNIIFEDYGNGWYRIGYKFVAYVSGNTQFVLYINDNNNNESYGGNGEAVYLWGAQVEAGSYPTSYIPNYGTALGVTRSAETCNNAGDVNTFNGSEGVLFVEMSALANDSTTRRINLRNSSGSNQIRIELGSSSNLITGVLYNGTNQAVINTTSYNVIDSNKIAFKYKQNDFALWVNGVKVDTDIIGTTIADGVLDRIDLSLGGTETYSNIKQIQYFDTALTDQELINLTTI